MNTFRVHLKNGNSFTVTAHHFDPKPNMGPPQQYSFYKDESTIDETILVVFGEVAAIVPEGEAPGVAAANVTRSTSGVRSR
jgi:5-deoxy-D-glucuronate isomerase